MAETKKTGVKKVAISEKNVDQTATQSRAKKTEKALSNQERYELIQQTAYFIAEHNGFMGDSLAFWVEAEAQINKMKR